MEFLKYDSENQGGFLNRPHRDCASLGAMLISQRDVFNFSDFSEKSRRHLPRLGQFVAVFEESFDYQLESDPTFPHGLLG